MKAYDYLEKKKIWFNGVYDDGKVKHHFICDLMEEYAQEQIKLLNLDFVSNSALPKLSEFAINSFKGIETQTKRLSSGNASHLGRSIEGCAKQAAEFIKKHYC